MDAQNRKKEPAIAFISYARRDQKYFDEFNDHLSALKRQLILDVRDHQHIVAGDERQQAIDTQLKVASLIFLLVSSNYLASDDCYAVMQRAIKRHKDREAQVIPILVRPVDIEGTFEEMRLLPENGKPISQQDSHAAWRDVVKNIRDIIKGSPLLAVSTPLSSPLRVWNITHRRNPFFTGRDELLARLVKSNKIPGQIQAVSGLAGIGKTQIVVEYAYRCKEEYQSVFWAQADTRDGLISSFAKAVQLLNLPEKDMQDQNSVVAAFKQWMKTHSKWLLILDNVEDLAMLHYFIPPEHNGHIILTTRIQSMGKFAQPVEVETMSPDEGGQFLLKRACIEADTYPEQVFSKIQTLALEIARELGGLPLALDQAGAYIEETQANLNSYLQLYRQEQASLLEQRGSVLGEDHPESVVKTFSISFQKVKETEPLAADLMHLCAFLHADAIPEEIITKGAVHLGPLLQTAATNPQLFNRAISVLRNYSLIKRDRDQNMLSVHRLVQIVLKSQLDDETRSHWAERTVKAVSAVFPEPEAATWVLCERMLPHAESCMQLIKEGNMKFPETERLLTRMGWYLRERARYKEAESVARQALTINRQRLETEHSDTARILNVLAGIYEAQGRYAEAESLYQRALAIYEKLEGPEHPYTIRNLNNLAGLYNAQSRYLEAEQLYQRALTICEKVQRQEEHSYTAEILSNLAYSYEDQGKDAEAEPLYRRALEIYEQQLGPDHLHTAAILNNLAELSCRQKKYTEAESHIRQALTTYRQQLGSDHPDTANSLNILAGIYFQQGKYAEAEPLIQKALAVREQRMGSDHPDTANSLHILGALYGVQEGKYPEAKDHLERALKIYEQQLGPDHLETASCLHNLARLHHRQEQYAEAEPLYRRALDIRKKRLGQDHPDTRLTIEKYRELLRNMEMKPQALPPDPPDITSPQTF
jgi:tetratricopeptide (TPR) repeat protein